MESQPTAVAVDDRGDGWVSGVHRTFDHFGEKQAGPIYRRGGAWLAYRPASGDFAPPIELYGGSSVRYATVAANAAGKVLAAWQTRSSLYIAWGDQNGALSPPQRVPLAVRIARIGLDDRGRGMVIADRGEGPFAETARAIVVLTAAYGRPFQRPHLLLRTRRDSRRHMTEYFRDAEAAVSLAGGAVVATSTVWIKDGPEPEEGPGRPLLLKVSATGSVLGQANPPGSYHPGYGIGLAADPAGAALLTPDPALLTTFTGSTPHRTIWRLPPGVYGTGTLTANSHGQLAAAAQGGPFEEETLNCLLADAAGKHRGFFRFPTPGGGLGDVTATIDGTGHGTAIWVVHRPRPHAVPVLYARPIQTHSPIVEVARAQGPPP